VLDRNFQAAAPNRKWIADFTYVWTAEGWLYVAAVVDLLSHRLVGWSMNAAMTSQLVTDALVMAIWRRGRPDALLRWRASSRRSRPSHGAQSLSHQERGRGRCVRLHRAVLQCHPTSFDQRTHRPC
jgi:transposase InsO family protein